MSLMSKNKGKRAERQAADLLYTKANDVAKEFGKEAIKVERNLNQTRDGGYDLTGTLHFAIEVKHHETLNLNAWWNQAYAQAVAANKEPVLLYKSNNKPWRVQMFMTHVVERKNIKLRVDMSIEAFLTIWVHECRKFYGSNN